MFVALILYTLVGGLSFYAFYKWSTKNHDYFVRHDVKHLMPNFLIGNTLGSYLMRYPSHIFLDKIYNSYPTEKLIGFFDFWQPIYMVRDPEVINQILVTKFSNFVNRISFIDVQADTVFGKSVVFLCGEKWRAMRSILATTFTGRKIRNMFDCFVAKTAHKFTQSLITRSQQTHGAQSHYEMKHLFDCYSADITASYAFGLEINSFENPTNEFVNQKILNYFTGSKQSLKFLLLTLFPNLMQAINFGLVPQRIRRFFKSAVLDTMNERAEKQIIRPDLINTLMRIRNERLKCENTKNQKWTDDDFVAQCFVIFMGFEDPATTMAFMSYELALNQDIQEKLYEEIRTVNERLDGGQLTFDALSKLKYLDQVIDETLRKWPPNTLTTRQCTKDVELDLGDGKTVNIERGMGFWIPLSSVQNDTDNFENSSKFDPERFNEENRHKIKAGSFIPFSIGPRQCTGKKFALMGMKTIIFYLLLNFSIQPYEETQIPLKYANTVIFYKTEKGIHLQLKPRSQN